MRNFIFLLFVVAGCFTWSSCHTAKEGDGIAKPLSIAGSEALGAYFTQNHHGDAVLCWTEKDLHDSLYRLKYAVYNSERNDFGSAVTVPGSAGCSTAAESMGKVAFKSDGTVMAIFGKKFKKEKSPYASAIYYSLSADQGKSWTEAIFVHKDTAHHYGRSFFDLTTLKNGELAAVWLDGRFGKTIKGSALFFASTEKGKGFTTETCLVKGTCECCRTNLIKDEKQNLHLAFRNIMYPLSHSGKQVRDMSYLFSSDQGKTFSALKTISNDNWEVEGCPHSGPSLATTPDAVHGAWFTAGGTPGIYYTKAALEGDFTKRTLISTHGRHPQLSVLSDGKLALVFEENIAGGAEAPAKAGHEMAAMQRVKHTAGTAKVVLKVWKDSEAGDTFDVSDGQHIDHHAVLTPIKDGALVAWVREGNGLSKLYFSKIALSN